ncbi:MAG: glycoside hydrolase family 3 protein [Bacteroidota bacterium]
MKYRIFTLILLATLFLACETSTTQKSTSPNPPKDAELEKMIGQMLMVGTRGMTINEVSPAFQQQIKEGKIGGIVLFDYDVVKKEYHRNIQSPEQVKSLVDGLQKLAPTPLFMAIDQEGGRVNRLKPTYGFPSSVSAQYLGDLDNIDSTRYYGNRTAAVCQELGFNVNFAPAVDVNYNPTSPAIGNIERSYSADPEMVIKHASILIEEQDQKGILSTLKHFPGHGSAQSDSHYGVTDVTKYWQESELIPFEKLGQMEEKVAIMTAHVVNQNLDSDYPATLSQKIITGILRQKLGFQGIIFSDDMQMQAVNDHFGFETLLERAILAGVDILVFGNNLKYDEQIPTKAIDAITKMVENGTISRERIEASYKRIMAVKRDLE